MKIINVTENNILELIKMLDKLNCKNLYLYWILIENKDVKMLDSIRNSINDVIKHYKIQISKMYILNLIEQHVLEKEDTQLSKIISRLKNKLDLEEILDEDIVNGLYLSNINSIFDKKEELQYNLTCDDKVKETIINNEYLTIAFKYANTFINNQKTKKKILNNV